MRAGETVRVTGIRQGLRVYLAVLGSFEAEYLQGSCAPDTILGFGPALRDGDELRLRMSCPPMDHPFSRIPLFRLHAPVPAFPTTWNIDVTDGPDRAEFGDTGALLFDAPFTVSPQSNHIGLRLRGAALPRRVTKGEVLSRGVPIGAVEVPAGDELLVLHRGRGVTAGYPVLAVVTATGLSALAQVRPGQTLRFRHRTRDQAVTAHRAQRTAVDALKTRVHTAFAALRIPASAAPPTRTVP